MLRPADKEKVINSREKVIILNPTSLSEYHSKILHLLLDQQRKNKVKVLEKNKEYQVTIPSTDQVSGNYVVKVMLTNTLVYRAKKLPGTSKKRIRYSVVSDVLLGAGDYGGVYLVSGTLVPRQNDKLIYKTHKRRAIKIQEHNFLKPVEIAVNEAELSQYVPYLHAKKLTFLKDESGKNYKSYMVEKLFNGETLDKILYEDKHNASIPIDKRIQISVNLLRALQQLHENGIMHRDLKTQNVIVDLATCEVVVIDLGLSRKSDKQDNRYSGNMAYKAPEAVTKKYPYDQNSDIYSLGLILAEIWHATPRDSIPWHTVQFVASELMADREVASLSTLFTNIPEVTADQKIFMQTMIKSMIEIKPQLRCSLKTSMNVLEEIRLQRRLYGHAVKDQQVRLAHEVAVELNHKLKELAAQATNNSFRVIEEVVSSALDRITDSKEAIATFATVLESKLFNQAVSKTEIKTLMSAAIEKFNQNEKQLQDLRRFHSDGQIIAGNELEELLDDIDECMAKCAKHHASLHHLAEFNANISKQIERLKSAVPEALIKVPKKEELPELEMVIADCKHDLSSNNKAPLDAASIKVSTYEGGFFNRSKLCSRSIDIIENYRHEPNLVRRRSP